jgi:hypothetical protein
VLLAARNESGHHVALNPRAPERAIRDHQAAAYVAAAENGGLATRPALTIPSRQPIQARHHQNVAGAAGRGARQNDQGAQDREPKPQVEAPTAL